MDMLVHGHDFRSAPSPNKPITRAECHFENDVLTIDEVNQLTNFTEFQSFLNTDGEWVAASISLSGNHENS